MKSDNTPQPVYSSSSGSDQFNGNIKAQRWFTQGQNDAPAYTYEYNKNQWLEKASFGQHDAARITANAQDDFGVSGLTYDANGNLLSLTRNKNTASGSNKMDDLSYHYKDGTNQLDHVVDAAGDVTDAADIGTQTPNNYIYNSIGQLTDNKDEKVGYVYNTAGLVTQITKNGATQLSIQYNDRGQRLSKTTPSGTTHYVRDAAGSVLGIYFDQSLTEQPVYGNSRLGVRYRASGKTAYQLSDHLGNVRAVVMDNEGQALSLTNRADYYPFGMPMPNRQTTDGDYRYAFQGQEKDKETGKEAFELRLWDARIGRWLTTDPKRQYSSPYLGMGNDPINGIDPDGGHKTRIGRLIAWVSGGFKGSFVNNEGSRFANQRFGILTTGNLDGGVVGTLSFGGDFYNDRMSSISAPSGFKSFLYDIDSFQNSTSKSTKEALGKIVLNLTYGTAENVYSLVSGKKFTGENLQGDHRVNAGVDGLTTVATAGLGSSVNSGLKTLKSSPGLYNSFAKQTRGMFKGASHNQLRSKAYHEMIRKHNFNVEHGRGAVNLMNDFTNAIEISSEISNQNN